MDSKMHLDPEAQLNGLFLLSLDCLAPHWELLCLHLPAQDKSIIHSEAQRLVQSELGREQLANPQALTDGLQKLEVRISELAPHVSGEIIEWASTFIGDEAQSKIEWHFRMSALNLANNPQPFANALHDDNQFRKICQLLQDFRSHSTRGRVSSMFSLENISNFDQRLLDLYKLPLGDKYMYPTLEMADEIAARIDFLSFWKEIVSQFPSETYQRLLDVLLKDCISHGGVDQVALHSSGPNIGACPFLVS